MAGIFGLLLSGAVTVVDQFFEYTTLLLPGNGTNGAQNNTFLDGSTNNFTITRNGNTTQGTFSPFSQTGWGNYFDGSGDSLTLTGVNLSSGNWTIECFVYIQSFATTLPHIFSIGTDGNNRFALYRNSATSKFNFVTVNSGVYVSAESTTAPTVGQWYHVAVVSNSGTRTLYVNGAAEVTSTTAINNGTSYSIGNLQFTPGASDPLTGYISNFRVVTSAVYTGNFTPPTSPLTAITNTALLTCQSNRFIDTNTQAAAKTITKNGDTRVVAFSPFNPSASWSAATYGGSGYFDGNGDQISAPNNAAFDFGSGNFTLEFWFYPTAQSSSVYIALMAKFANASAYAPFVITQKPSSYDVALFSSSNGSAWNLSDGTTSNFGTMIPNAWNHIAVAREGVNVRCFLNGSLNQTINFSTTALMTNTDPVYVGGGNSANNYSTGYIASLRIVKGTAVYTGAFTPPSLLPLTNAGSTSAASYPSTTNVNTSFASSATSLLLNFTNAGVYDATSKNDLETVGNAQISTSVSKFGGGSIAFDGTGDYLTLPSSNLLAFGSGDFTLEFWIYPTSAAATNALIMWTTSGDYIALAMNTSRNVVLDRYGTATLATTSNTLTLNTWNHVAVARSGVTLQIYINGTSGASITNSTNWQASTIQIGNNGFTSYLFGYLEYLRITKGYARYTSNFTAPTAAFPTL